MFAPNVGVGLENCTHIQRGIFELSTNGFSVFFHFAGFWGAKNYMLLPRTLEPPITSEKRSKNSIPREFWNAPNYMYANFQSPTPKRIGANICLYTIGKFRLFSNKHFEISSVCWLHIFTAAVANGTITDTALYCFCTIDECEVMPFVVTFFLRVLPFYFISSTSIVPPHLDPRGMSWYTTISHTSSQQLQAVCPVAIVLLMGLVLPESCRVESA